MVMQHGMQAAGIRGSQTARAALPAPPTRPHHRPPPVIPHLTSARTASCCISGMRRQSPAGAHTGHTHLIYPQTRDGKGSMPVNTCAVTTATHRRPTHSTPPHSTPQSPRPAPPRPHTPRHTTPQPPNHPPVCSTGRCPGGSNSAMTAPGQWLASRNVRRVPSTVMGLCSGTTLQWPGHTRVGGQAGRLGCRAALSSSDGWFPQHPPQPTPCPIPAPTPQHLPPALT